ncbi:hypothetical protein HHI36_020355 [Cryptolaemus montrouzieri]|uniref:Uncharacterized protein n=1 Tax=Cryptolaemus montrouzieri TaxID=559131 RepID=A0ABD2NAE4_9CUCU
MLNEYKIFLVNVKVKYKYFRGIKNFNLIHPTDFNFNYNVTFKDDHFSGSESFWNRIKYYSVDPEHVVIIIARDAEELSKALHLDFKFFMKHHRSLYLILFTTMNTSSCYEFKRRIGNLLYLMWHIRKVLNVIAQAPCVCEQKEIYIYKPFYQTGVKNWGALDVFLMKDDVKTIRRMMNTMLNMNKMPMNISIFDRIPTATTHVSDYMKFNFIYRNLYLSGGFSGVDGALLENFARFMNFTTIIVGCETISDCYGQRLPNGTITSSLSTIASGQAEISMNGRFLKNYSTENIEFTMTIYSDYVCAIVPKAKIIPTWVYLYKAFDIISWICIFLCINFYIVVWYILKQINSILELSTEIYMKEGSTNIRMTKSQCIFISTCLLSSVIFSGIFQAVLVKSYSIKTRFEDIHNLQELIDKDFLILSSLNIFADDSTEIIQKLNKRALNDFLEKSISIVSMSTKFATFERKRDANYWIEANFTDINDDPLLHIVEECPVSYNLAYIVPHGSPYLKRFNDLISVFREAGFIEYWYGMMVENLITEIKIHETRKPLLGSKSTWREVNEFTNYFLRMLNQSELFFVEVKVKYKYFPGIEEFPVQRPVYFDDFNDTVTFKHDFFSGTRSWDRIKYYSADPEFVVIMIAWDAVELMEALNVDFSFFINYRRSLYLTLFASTNSSSCLEIRKNIGNVLYFLWHTQRVLNVIAQNPCVCEQNYVYIFKPFYQTGGSNWGALDVFMMEDNEKSIRRMMNTLLNMNKMPMNISIFEQIPTATTHVSDYMKRNFIYRNLYLSNGFSGVDGALLENFARFMNFTTNIVSSDTNSHSYGEKYLNGTITGSLGIIAKGKAEISTNVIFTGMFQAILVKSYATKTRFEDIHNLQELIDRDFLILSSFDIFVDDNTEVIQELNKRTLSNFIENSMYIVSTSRSFVTFERKRDANFWIEANFTNLDDEPLLHIVEECPAYYNLAFIVPFGSPYLKRFNYLISVLEKLDLLNTGML